MPDNNDSQAPSQFLNQVKEAVPAVMAVAVLGLFAAGTSLTFLVGCQQMMTNDSDLVQQAAQKQLEQTETTDTFSLELYPKQEGYIAFDDINDLPTAELINELNALGVFKDLNTPTADKAPTAPEANEPAQPDEAPQTEDTSATPHFRPNDTITRGEYVHWAFVAHNALRPEGEQLPLPQSTLPLYEDVPSDHPQFAYIQAFAEAGLPMGERDNKFRPDEPITREEMIALKYALDVGKIPSKPYYATKLLRYTDREEVSEAYRAGVFYDSDHIKGPFRGNSHRAFGDTKLFKPSQPVLRHEAAATLWQADKTGQYTAREALRTISKPSR